MLSGNNGVLQRATDAKTKSDEAQIKERIQLAYHSALTGGQGSYTKESLEDELEKEFGENNYNVDDSGSDNWVLTGKVYEKEQSVTVPAGITEFVEDTTWQTAFENGYYDRYILDEENKTITLRSGPPVSAESIVIEKQAVINGIKYNTKFPDSCSNLFAGSSNLKSISIDSNIDTTNITNMESMFSGCSKLTTVEMPNFATNNVTNMKSLFTNCPLLKNIDLSNWDTSNVQNMYQMFMKCDTLVNLDLSMFDTRNVINMVNMFRWCYDVESITVSNNFVTSNVSESDSMFLGDTKLVGGNGTTYNDSKTDVTMAHIDTVENPGYFTEK